MGKEWARVRGLVCVLWLPCTTSSSLVYSPVCATCRSIVNSLFLVCLLFVALCICCCLSRFWCYANLCKACGQCRFLLWRKCYKCKYSYVCMFVLPTRLVTQSQQWAASSGQMCLAFLSLELLLRKYLCLHFAYFMDHHARPADRQSIDICTHIHTRIYQSKCSILFIGNFVV